MLPNNDELGWVPNNGAVAVAPKELLLFPPNDGVLDVVCPKPKPEFAGWLEFDPKAPKDVVFCGVDPKPEC